jgi:2-phospho-L-lactate guanylyltransferase
MKVWAVIPAKAFDTAKSRLSPLLSPREREALAEEMFDHVLATCVRSPSIVGLQIVTTCPKITKRAQEMGARTSHDVDGLLGDSIDAGLAALPPGAIGALVVMADLPHLTVADLEALAEGLDDAPLVVAPDREDEGTNALAIRVPAPVRTAFGRRDSFSEHLKRAAEARQAVLIHRSATLGFDVDWPQDVGLIHHEEKLAAS